MGRPNKTTKRSACSASRTAELAGETFTYDRQAAADACDFFARWLTHGKGQMGGKPLALSQWQRDELVGPLFGWRRPDGTRRYRTCYLEVPRKNGKSTLCAGIALLLLLCDREPGAEIYSAAGDLEQARIVFEMARQMIAQNPKLKKMVKVYKGAIVVQKTASAYKVLSSEAYSKHGLNAHGIIFDELHTQPDRELWDVLRTSVGARRQPLTLAITTAGFNRNSLCWQEHEYAERVREKPELDPYHLPLIYAAAPDDDWRSPATWAKANPGLGTSVRPEYLAQECAKAADSPALENTFRRLHLNQWTEQDVRWLSMERWDRCGRRPIDREALRGQACYAGVDLSSTTDLTAVVLVFPRPQTSGATRYVVLPFFFVPADNRAARQRKDRVPYDTWTARGLIEATPGNVVDYDRVRARINELHKEYRIKEIAIDRWNSTQLQTQLAGDGFTVAEFGQGYASMSAPTKELEALVLADRVEHGGHEVLRWCAANVAVETDAAGNLKPSKGKSTERIDGIVATVMALGRAMVQPTHRSVYETRGVLTI